MGFCHVYFDENVCDGCNTCVEICMSDVFARNPENGKPPVVKFPEECWFCGCCVTDCPHSSEGAIKIVTPFPMRGSFRRT